MILDELFGKATFVGTFVWNTRNTDNRVKSYLSPDHEYIVVYSKRAQKAILGRVVDRSDFKNPDNDPRGPYVTDPLTGKATAADRPNLHAYNMEQPGTPNIWKPDPAKGWITDEEGYKKLLADNRIWWPPSPRTGKPRKKRFLSETQVRMPASSFWPEFRAQSGAAEVEGILGEQVFAFPKPVNVIQKVIDHCAPPGSIVLDSFAGSGTTAHAVMAQNRDDGGNRQFILVELDGGISKNVTAKRLQNVITSYQNAGAETIGSGFRYCRLGRTLLDANGNINGAVPFADLARYVFLLATGVPAPKQPRKDCPLLGVHHGQAIYLLYNGVLGDRRPAGGNVLTRAVLDSLPPHPEGRGPRVVYGEACRLGQATLRRENLTFRQIPYTLRD